MRWLSLCTLDRHDWSLSHHRRGHRSDVIQKSHCCPCTIRSVGDFSFPSLSLTLWSHNGSGSYSENLRGLWCTYPTVSALLWPPPQKTTWLMSCGCRGPSLLPSSLISRPIGWKSVDSSKWERLICFEVYTRIQLPLGSLVLICNHIPDSPAPRLVHTHWGSRRPPAKACHP